MSHTKSISPSKDWPSRDPRRLEIMVARMRGACTVKQDIVVRNLSERGIGARARDCPPGLGETVALTLGVMPERQATVRWVRGDQFGLQLSEPLSAAELERLSVRAAEIKPGFLII